MASIWLRRAGKAVAWTLTGQLAARLRSRGGAAERGEPVLHLPLDYEFTPLRPEPSVALILRVRSGDEAADMRPWLRNSPAGAALFVASAPGAEDQVRAALAGEGFARLEVRSAVSGLAGAMAAFGPDLGGFDLVLHLSPSPHRVLNDVLGSPAVVESVVEGFARLPGLGVMAPRTPRADRSGMDWGQVFHACRDHAASMGLSLAPDSPLDWPRHGIFWARAAALEPLSRVLGSQAAVPDAVLSRLIFLACEATGLRWTHAGSQAGIRAPEILVRATGPAELARIVGDQGRALILRGRRPRPTLRRFSGPSAEKSAIRRLYRDDLDAFLAGDDRLILPTSDRPEVSVILVLFNQADLTHQALRALMVALDRPAEVIIVDNASSDDTGRLLDRVDGARIVRNTENLHFLRAVNQAAGHVAGEAILLLNNDAQLIPGSLAAGCAVLDEQADVGAVAGRIDLLDGTLQEAGSIVWRDGTCSGYGRGADPWAPEFQFRRDVDYGSGAILLVRRSLFEALGRFDEAFAPAYYEETDLCLRIWSAGSRVVYEPGMALRHFEFGSSSGEGAVALQRRNLETFRDRHRAVLALQPGRAEGALVARMRDRGAGRLLVIEDAAPRASLGAGHPRTLSLLRAANEAGWFVTLYPLVDPHADLEAAYRGIPREVEIASGHGAAGLAGFLAARRGYYDALLVSRPHNMAALGEILHDDPDLLGGTRLIYDAEAIFALRAPGGGGQAALSAELALAANADIVLAVNPAEAGRFRETGLRDVRVLGHALDPRPGRASFAGRQDLLFVGALDEDSSPNVDSLVWFVDEIAPRLDALIGSDWRLKAAGRNASARVRALAGPRVALLGPVEDLTALYSGARLFVAPTRFAAGIPMKVHEAAAAGLPVVATPLLAGQLEWTSGVELLTGADAEAFAQACARLYRDEALWTAIRTSALARVGRDTDPKIFAATLAGVLADVRRRRR